LSGQRRDGNKTKKLSYKPKLAGWLTGWLAKLANVSEQKQLRSAIKECCHKISNHRRQSGQSDLDTWTRTGIGFGIGIGLILLAKKACAGEHFMFTTGPQRQQRKYK